MQGNYGINLHFGENIILNLIQWFISYLSSPDVCSLELI